jgi:catechol 2,3-dioxygenase-like lactoylglutathione lyase family enzyme
MTQKIDIVTIPVSDQVRAKQFYMDILGFEVVYEGQMGPDQKWIQLRLPDTETSITLVTWFESMPAGSLRGLVIATPDINATRAELIAKGVEASEIEDAPWGKMTMFSDPDGNGLIMMQGAF